MTQYNVIISRKYACSNENELSISLYILSNDDDRFIWLQSISGREVCCWRLVRHYSFIQVVATRVLCFQKKGHIKTEKHVYKWPKFRTNIYALRSFLGRAFKMKKKTKKSNIKNVEQITELEQ